MSDYKMEAAKASLKFIKNNQVIGLGGGSTIIKLADLIHADENLDLSSLTFVSSSFKTRAYLVEKGLNVKLSSMVSKVDVYFDGCDQLDEQLNALKSGGGIHTSEKILASMAEEFILIGDESKIKPKLDTTYPLVVELLQEALPLVFNTIKLKYPDSITELRMASQKDGAVISDNGNLLAEIRFIELPELKELNTFVKLIPGVADHSLFYQLASKAVIAGAQGVKVLVMKKAE